MKHILRVVLSVVALAFLAGATQSAYAATHSGHHHKSHRHGHRGHAGSHHRAGHHNASRTQ